MSDMKQVIIVRLDLGLSTGKLAAQSCHACLGAYKKTGTLIKKTWELEGAKKVVLGCEGLEQLKELEVKAKQLKLATYLVRDAGHTEVPPGTITALGIGPGKESVVDRVTGSLKLLK